MKSKSNKKDYFNMDRRKLPKIFWHDGVIDVIRSKTIENHKDLVGDKIIYIENRFPYLIDIDSPQDLKIANLLVKSGEIKF